MSFTIRVLFLLSVMLSGFVAKSQDDEGRSVAEMIQTYRYPVQYFSMDDSTKVAYVDEGRGEETLLFIHGLATYLPAWYPTIDHFSASYRCIAVDLPGYGRSSKGDYPATMAFYSEVIGKMIRELGLEKVTLVGHSMGGQVVVTTALDHGELVQQLVLLAPAGFETFSEQHSTWLKNIFTPESVLGATEEQIRANWALNFFEVPEAVEFMITDRLAMREAEDFRSYCETVSKGVHAMLDGPVFERLREITQRALVVYGADDALIPNRYLNPTLTTKMVAESGVERIPDAVLRLIPECGHFMSYDRPEEVNRVIGDFLADD